MVHASFAERLRALMAERGIGVRALARQVPCDPGMVSRYASGHKMPSPAMAARLDAALDADGELAAMVGPNTPATVPSADAVERPVWSLDRRSVTAGDVAAVWAFTATFRNLDNQFGGGHAHALAVGYLESTVAAMLREGTYTDTAGKDLFGAASQLAHLAAWTAYDMGSHETARRFFARSLELAAGDPAFGGEILAAKGHHAIHLGNPVQAVELARASQHAARVSAVPVLLAEALVLEANGLAVLGETKPCVAALHAAEGAFDQATAAEPPAWLGYCDEGYLAARSAHTLRDLGDWDGAVRHAQLAVSMSPGMTRTRAFNTVILATAYVEIDLEQACDTGVEALELAATLRSSRAVHYVGDLQNRLAERHPNEPLVAQFTERVTETIGAA